MDLFFWNINNQKPAVDVISALDFSSKDILFCISEFWEVTNYIQSKSYRYSFLFNEASSRTGVLCSKQTNIVLEKGFRFWTRYRFLLHGKRIFLYVLHLSSLVYSEIDSERLNSNVILEIIKDINEIGVDNVILAGDFNLPCFHNVFFDFYHLNSTDYWRTDEKECKTYQNEKRIKFYNPMGSFSGDLSNGPPGTYYYPKPSQSQAWHIFDNILISYPLVPYVDRQNSAILTELNGARLISPNGRPDTKLSDHLPIMILLT